MTTEYEAITESEWKDLATTEITHLTDEEKDYLPRAWDEWIARVKRDAAREALAAAEHRATRAEAQSAIRGRAVVIYRKRAEEAEVAARWAHDRAYKADLSWEDEKRRADQAEASRDEWRQTALDERGAALDALEQIKARDARIKAVRELHVYENRPVEKWARGHRFTGEHCAHDGEQWPCRTIRALEGDA